MLYPWLNNSQFQSTLPVKGATSAQVRIIIIMGKFQSTLPVKGATAKKFHFFFENLISIHAPCEGSDISHSRK